MSPSALFDPAFCSRLCLTLLHSLWQVALLAVVAWLIDRLVRKRSVQRSYLLYVAALALAVVALPVTFLIVEVPANSPLQVEVTEQTLPAATVEIPAATPLATSSTAANQPSSQPPPDISNLPFDAPATVEQTSYKTFLQLAAPWLAGSYAFGVGIMLIRLLRGIFTAQRLGNGAEPILAGPILNTMQTLCRQWSIRVAPRLAAAEQIVVPKVVGLLKPTILLPATALTGLSTDELEMIVAHELAHVRRHDMWVNLLQRLTEITLFFNPALWYLSRHISTLREYCCDEMACQAMSGTAAEPQLRYATALLRVVELAKPSKAAHSDLASLAASGRSPSELRRRVARLFGEPIHEPVRVSRGGIISLMTIALLLASGPAIWPTGAQTTDITDETQESDTQPTTEADRIVAAARKKTFGLHNVSRNIFLQTYRQAEIDSMQGVEEVSLAELWRARTMSAADGLLAELWRARTLPVEEAQLNRVRHTLTLAWDDQELLIKTDSPPRPGEKYTQTRYWDGKEGWQGEVTGDKRHVYRYSKLAKLTEGVMPFHFPHWGAAGGRLPWGGPEVVIMDNEVAPSQTHYRLVDTETIDGSECDVYAGPERQEKIWIDRASGLVKAVSKHYVSDLTEAEAFKIISDAARRNFSNPKALAEWLKSLSSTEQARVEARWAAATWPYATPGHLTVFSNYREAAPGVQWPMKAERIHVREEDREGKKFFFSRAEIIVSQQKNDYKIRELAAEAIPTAGVEVTDRREEIALDYEWEKDMSETAIAELREKQLAERRKQEEAEPPHFMNNRFIICPVTTDLQRSLLGYHSEPAKDVSVCVFINARSFESLDDINRQADGIDELVTKLFDFSLDDNRDLRFRIIDSVSDELSFNERKNRLDALEKFVQKLGESCGFKSVRVMRTTHPGNFKWGEYVESAQAASKGNSDAGESATEAGQIRVTPVKTFLSHLLVNADCVADFLPIVQNAKGVRFLDDVLPVVSEAVSKLKQQEGKNLLIRIRYSKTVEQELEKWNNDFAARKAYAKKLGFELCNVSMSQIAESEEEVSDTHATISGRIVLEDGSPATVKGWLHYDSKLKNNSVLGTDDQYTESFSCKVPAGTIWLSYFPNGFAPTGAGPFELKPGEELADVTIVLKPGFSELVRVTNEQGKSVVGATLVAYPEINGSTNGPMHEHTTDEHGEYMLEHLSDTRYQLNITAPGYEPLRTALLRVGPDEILRPTMIRSKPGTGIVRFADGTPAPGSKLYCKREIREDGKNFAYGGAYGTLFTTCNSTELGSVGRFSLDQLTSGSHYLFVVEAVDGARAIVSDLQAGQKDVQIVLPRRRDLVVKISGDLSNLPKRRGKPFVSVRQRIDFRPALGKQFGELIGDDVPIELTDNGGMAIFRGLAVDLSENAKPQQVEVSLNYPNGPKKIVDINLTGMTNVEFVLDEDISTSENSMTVRIFDTDGKPIQNVKVRQNHALVWPNGERPITIKNQNYFTNSDGEIVLTWTGVSEGLKIWITKPGYVPMHAIWLKNSLTDGNKLPTELQIELQVGTEIGGIVTNKEGEPIEGVKVEIMDASALSFHFTHPNQLWRRPVRHSGLTEDDTALFTNAEGRWMASNVPQDGNLVFLDDHIKNRYDCPLRLLLTHPDYQSYDGIKNPKGGRGPSLLELRDKTAKVILIHAVDKPQDNKEKAEDNTNTEHPLKNNVSDAGLPDTITANLPGRLLLVARIDEKAKAKEEIPYSLISVEPNTGEWEEKLDLPSGSLLSTVSDDGKQAYFRYHNGENGGILLLNTDGQSEPKHISNHTGTVSSSPDGKQLIISYRDLFSRSKSDEKKTEPIAKKDADFTLTIDLPPSEEKKNEPIVKKNDDWTLTIIPSPEGHWLIDLEDGTEKTLDLPTTYQIEDWSPSEDSLVATSWLNDQEFFGDLYLMHADGTERHKLTSHGGGCSQPCFSSAGKQVAYCRSSQDFVLRTRRSSVHILDLATKADRELIGHDNTMKGDTSDPPYTWYHRPIWSPDDKWLAVAFNRQKATSLDFAIHEQGILLISSDGSQQKELILQDGADFSHGFHLSWK